VLKFGVRTTIGIHGRRPHAPTPLPIPRKIWFELCAPQNATQNLKRKSAEKHSEFPIIKPSQERTSASRPNSIGKELKFGQCAISLSLRNTAKRLLMFQPYCARSHAQGSKCGDLKTSYRAAPRHLFTDPSFPTSISPLSNGRVADFVSR
jgi:hypothetical protein